MYKYLFGIIAILGLSLYLSINTSTKQKDRADRMTEQYQKAELDNKQLTVTYKELTSSQKHRIGELSDSLDIKPKQITKYVTIHTVDTIRDTVYAEVVKIDSNTFKFSKDTGCFKVEGLVKLTSKDPIVQITKMDYVNEINYIVYLDRKEWKLWFIKSKLFGRKESELEVIQDCGVSKVEDVELIKR